MLTFRIVPTVAVGLLLAATAGADPQYRLRLSSSFTDPDAIHAPIGGSRTLYLWYDSPSADGVASLEFRLVPPPGDVSVLFTAHNGFRNIGGPTDVILEVATCPTGPVIAASWLVTDTMGDPFCLEANGGTGLLQATDCSDAEWPVDVVCFRDPGVPPPPPGHGYRWWISSSSIDAEVNSSPAPSGGLIPLYLWVAGGPDELGLSAAAFAFLTPGTPQFGFTPMNGFLNAGGSTDLLLAVGGCPLGPVLVGSWNVWDIATGDYTLGASTVTPSPRASDCATPDPVEHVIDVVPFHVGTVANEPVTWGRLKARYR